MYNMQSEKSTFPRIFYHSSIEWKDDIEEVKSFKTTPFIWHGYLLISSGVLIVGVKVE